MMLSDWTKFSVVLKIGLGYSAEISNLLEKKYPIVSTLCLFDMERQSGPMNSFICCLLWDWYGNSSVCMWLNSLLRKFITILKGVKRDSVLSPTVFNNVIWTITKNIPQSLIETCIDVSQPCYADNIRLLSNDLLVLQNTANSICSCLNEIGLKVASSKAELFV